MITQALNLNLIPGQVLPRVNVSQYDSGTRTLQMSLYNGTQTFNVTSGVLAFIQGTKPDRTGFQYSATVTTGSNVVTADITQQMTAVSGDVVTELVLVSGDDQIATVNFIIHVEAAALADDTVISDTDLPLIEEAAELAERIDGIIAQIDADADKSEAYAVGTKGGTPVPSTDPTYHNNSKYYAQDAGDKATAAGTSATSASTNALKAEGFAVGEQNGTAVTSGSPYYHNNAEYFAGEASTSATNASTSETNAGLSESAAAQSEEDSEAWAVGERNGVPVTSGDPTYQNNAKYYAQQAGGTALSSLVDVAISGATNGQVLAYNSTSTKWENESLGSAAAKNSTNAVTQSSTDLVESGAVYTEIASVKSDLTNLEGRNLFDNPFFTLNSRGKSVYNSGSGEYTVDRWLNWSTAGNSITVNSDHSLTFTKTATANNIHFSQEISSEIGDAIEGKTVTLSAMMSDGTIKSVTGAIDKVDTTKIYISIDATMDCYLEYYYYNGWHVRIVSWDNSGAASTVTVKAVKLEVGSVSTLAHDIAPNYAMELAKCKASTADPTDTYANQGQINVGTPNPNLLDNPWFTVNQRGFSSYSADAYTVDRWKRNASSAYGHKFTVGSIEIPALNGDFYEPILDADCHLEAGQAYTLSAIIDGSLYSYTFTAYGDGQNHQELPDIGLDGLRFNIIENWDTGSKMHLFGINNNAATTDHVIKAAKLEFGTVSTLAMDTAPNYAEELLKCQRYFYKNNSNTQMFAYIGMGVSNAGAVYTDVLLPTPMRTWPSLILSLANTGVINVIGDGNMYATNETPTIERLIGNDVMIRIGGGTVANAPDNHNYFVRFNETIGNIAFSADL